MVRGLPDQLDTHVVENGANFSVWEAFWDDHHVKIDNIIIGYDYDIKDIGYNIPQFTNYLITLIYLIYLLVLSM